MTDIQDEEDAISLLNLLPANPGTNTKDLAQWLRDCYPPHTDGNNKPPSWCKHLEPDRIGEHLIVSEADDLEPLLRKLLYPSRVGTPSLRTWTVLERASTDPHLNERVGRILNEVLVEVCQAVHTQAVESQSSDLTAGFVKLFSAVHPHIDPDISYQAKSTLPEGNYLTTFLEYELAQHAADIIIPIDDTSELDQATYALRKLSLSRCLANIGRPDDALEVAEQATNRYRALVERNPATYTPNLASCLNTLAILQAENGRKSKALKSSRKATKLYRDLAKHNPATYTPNLASSLSNLAVYLAGNEQQHEALRTSQEATELCQQLVNEHFRAFSGRFATTLETHARILEHCGDATEATCIRQRRDEILERMKEMEEDDA